MLACLFCTNVRYNFFSFTVIHLTSVANNDQDESIGRFGLFLFNEYSLVFWYISANL